MATFTSYSSDSDDEETVCRASKHSTLVREEEEEDDIRRLEFQLAALKSKKGAASTTRSRSKQSHEKDDPPPPYSEVNTGSISKTRNNTTNGRGSVTNSSMSHTVQHTREMSAIQQQMQQELEEQKKLKEAQQKLNRIKQKTSEMELAKIRAENVKLREETIQTASKTRTFTQSLTQEKHLKDKAQKRREEISQVLRAMKKASIVDVCFLLDCTGSMRSFIEEVKSKINWLVAEITQRHKDVETLNLAFVGYRDLCNKEKNYSILQFTKSATVFRDFVAGVKAEGGCSHTADVAGGLDQVSKLSWTAPLTRVLIHVCDVSGHGRQYHIKTGLQDPYPDGDPRGLAFSPNTLIPKLVHQTSISFYVFMRLTEYTDKMIKEFASIAKSAHGLAASGGGGSSRGGGGCGENQEWLREMPLESCADLMTTAMESISSTISTMESCTVSSLLHGGSSSSIKPAFKDFVIDTNIPAWSIVPAEPVFVFQHQLPRMNPRDFKAGKVDVSLLKVPLAVSKKDRLLKIAPNPFAKGGSRLAFYGMDVTPFHVAAPAGVVAQVSPKEDDNNLVVLKEFLRVGGRANSKESYIEQIEVQAVGMHLALQFNKVKPKDTKDIKFLKESLVSFHGRENPAYFTKESRIEGEYTKFNNNWGYVNEKEYHSLLHAFSHWTWHVTGGFLQVVDLQGLKSGEVFRLTDPVIHCQDVTRFGKTNFGGKGMDRFFETHLCNEICSEMKLPLSNPKSSRE